MGSCKCHLDLYDSKNAPVKSSFYIYFEVLVHFDSSLL